MLQYLKATSQEWYRMCWNSRNQVRCPLTQHRGRHLDTQLEGSGSHQVQGPLGVREGRAVPGQVGPPQSPPGGSGVPSPQPHLAPPHQLCVQVSSSVLRQPTSNSVPKISTTQMMEAWEADKGKGLEEERYGQRGSRIPSILCVHAHLNEAQVKRL